nr:response regulator [Saprospiraceae bacterium]
MKGPSGLMYLFPWIFSLLPLNTNGIAAPIFNCPLDLLSQLETAFNEDLVNSFSEGNTFHLIGSLESILHQSDSTHAIQNQQILFVLSWVLLKDGQCERADFFLKQLSRDIKWKEWDLFFYHGLQMRYWLCLKNIPQAIASLEEMGKYKTDVILQDFYLNYQRAVLFKVQGQYEQMIDALEMALAAADLLEWTHHQLTTLYEMGFAYAELRNYPRAIHFLNRGIQLSERESNPFYLWKMSACLGISHIESGNYSLGVEYLEKSERLSSEINQPQLCGNSAFFAKGLFMTGRESRALEEANTAWYTVKDSDDIRDRRNVLHALYDIYKMSGDYEKALEVGERWSEHREALYEREYDRMVAEVEAMFQLRESEMRLAERENSLQLERANAAKKKIWAWLGFSLSLVFLALVAVIYYHLRSRKKIAELLESKNRELKNIDRAKTQFFENLSHEFRTPLTLIIGHLEEIKDRAKSEALQKSITTALRSSNRLKDLVTQILELSKLKTGDFKLTQSEIFPKDWFMQKLEGFQSLARSKQLTLKTEIDHLDKLSIQMDEDKLEKIINNLLYNACKFSNPGGAVWCRVQFEKIEEKSESNGWGMLRVQVDDQGPGIPQKIRNLIFDRNFHSELSTTSEPGYGIGLALSKSLVEAMKGELKLLEKEGAGSLFELKIPAEYCRINNYPVAENHSVNNITTSPITKKLSFSENIHKILVVENHLETAGYLKNILSPYYSVFHAQNGREALLILRNRKIDLVLSDLQMPVMDGNELLENIRNNPSLFQNIPFVMLSGDVSDSTKRKILLAGADAFVHKPIVKENLVVRIKSILSQLESRKKLRIWDKINTEDAENLKKLFLAEKIILERISDNQLKIKDVARKLSVSNRTLERLFKKHHRVSPVKYVRNLRLKIAYHLLSDGRCESVAEARDMTGFNSPSYFSRAFYEKYKLNPSEVLDKKTVL